MRISKCIIVLIGILLLFFSIPLVNATVIVPFGDQSIFWPGWDNGSGDDNDDTIGVPNFTGGTAQFEGGYLTHLIINRVPGDNLYGVLSPGDLFINAGADNDWDYVVDLTSWTTAGPGSPDPAVGNQNIYSVSLALDSSTDYISSGTDNSGGWSGYYIRDDHPVAWNHTWYNTDGDPYTVEADPSAYGLVDFSGWVDTGGNPVTSYTFDFTGLSGGGLNVGTDPSIIGWTLNCANDVIYEEVNPVPEPATILLLGSGLMGLAALRRKRKHP